jgi:hypothetical protein
MTIMTQGDNEHQRRCDATCHNAKHATCTCICGGRYHGTGAMAQERLTEDWLGRDWREKKAAIERHGGSFEAVVAQALKASLAPQQRCLPGLAPVKSATR